MIRSIMIVLALSLIGDTLADALRWPVPGAAMGLVMLAALFALRGGPDEDSTRLFDTISPVFPMFFVPAAVGVVANSEILAQSWAYVAVAIALGTTATIAVTGLLAQFLLNSVREAPAE